MIQSIMAEGKLDTLELLLQTDVTGALLPTVGKEQWQTLYSIGNPRQDRFGLWCALLDDDAAAKAMDRDGWDLSIGESGPGFSQGLRSGKQITTYHRFGGSEGTRALVLYREFHGAFPRYVEIDEEFRLYHNLAEDKARGLLLDFDTSGREIEVVRIKPTEVRARLKYLRQFQAGTRLNLAIYIDSVRYSKIALGDVPADEHERVHQEGRLRWRRNVARCDFKEGYDTFSRLLCKVILEPPPREKAGIWPYDDKDSQQAVAFIVGVDEDGNDTEYTSDPDSLANYFGANPGAPHYLTPIYFRREVLVKYYAEPERYEISDGRLTCLGLWGCQIDNDLASHVVVFLGDLGRDLPYEERLHWRQFNVAPGKGVSSTNFKRSFLAQFADAQAPDLMFRHEYANVNREWVRTHGWPLFLTLSAGDSHLLNTVRIPVTNSQTELDEQVGTIAKLLVDSLNEKELAARAGSLEAGTKGITKLDAFLETTQFPEREKFIQLLRDVQTLRSTGSAHRKGSAYENIVAKLGVDPTNRAETVRRILEEATRGLRAVRLHYCKPSDPTDE